MPSRLYPSLLDALPAIVDGAHLIRVVDPIRRWEAVEVLVAEPVSSDDTIRFVTVAIDLSQPDQVANLRSVVKSLTGSDSAMRFDTEGGK
jgi:hypothetical protein